MPPETLAWASALKDVALSTLLLIVLYGGFKKWWVFGYQLTQAEAREMKCQAEYEKRLEGAQLREDEWKQVALNGGYLAKQAVDLAKRQSSSGRS